MGYITEQRRINGTSDRPSHHTSNRVFHTEHQQGRTAETYTTFSSVQSITTVGGVPLAGSRGPTFINTTIGSTCDVTVTDGGMQEETVTIPGGMTITNITDGSPPPGIRRRGVKLRRQIVLDGMNTPITRQVLTMGFDPESVRKAVSR